LVLNAGVLATAGIVLSACGRGDDLPLETTLGTSFEYLPPHQAAILSDVADMLIPQTETVGAADTETILYLDQLMLKWAGERTKLEIEDFIDSLEAEALARYQSNYLNMPEDKRKEFLQEIDAASFSENLDTVPVKSYRRVKWLIFHIHYTSEAANPDFVLIPGQYTGNVSEAEYLALVDENRY
jgi:hypothetical protein